MEMHVNSILLVDAERNHSANRNPYDARPAEGSFPDRVTVPMQDAECIDSNFRNLQNEQSSANNYNERVKNITYSEDQVTQGLYCVTPMTEESDQIHQNPSDSVFNDAHTLPIDSCDTYYRDLLNYITTKNFPDNATMNHKLLLKRRAKNYSIVDGTLFYGTKRVITNKEEQLRILEKTHIEEKSGVHRGVKKMSCIINAECFWSGLYVDISNFVRQCKKCTESMEPEGTSSDIMELDCPTDVMKCYKSNDMWQKVEVNIHGPYMRENAERIFIATMVDPVTHYLIARPLKGENSTTQLAAFILETFCTYGFSKCYLGSTCRQYLDSVKLFFLQKNALFANVLELLKLPSHTALQDTVFVLPDEIEGQYKWVQTCLDPFICSDLPFCETDLLVYIFKVNSKCTSGSPFFKMFGRQASRYTDDKENADGNVLSHKNDVRSMCRRRRLRSSTLQCRHCDEIFTSKISFRIHQRKHTNDAHMRGMLEGQAVRLLADRERRALRRPLMKHKHPSLKRRGSMQHDDCSSFNIGERKSVQTDIPDGRRAELRAGAVEAVKKLLATNKDCRKRRGKYKKFSSEIQEEMARYAIEHGSLKTVRHFSEKLGVVVSESTVRNIVKWYQCFTPDVKEEIDCQDKPRIKHSKSSRKCSKHRDSSSRRCKDYSKFPNMSSNKIFNVPWLANTEEQSRNNETNAEKLLHNCPAPVSKSTDEDYKMEETVEEMSGTVGDNIQPDLGIQNQEKTENVYKIVNQEGIRCSDDIRQKDTGANRSQEFLEVSGNLKSDSGHLYFQKTDLVDRLKNAHLHSYQSHCCKLCGATFQSVTGMKMHVQSVHEPSKNYSCIQCNYVGKCTNSLTLHVSRKHKKKFKCSECDYASIFEGGLERHMRLVHSCEERLFPCQQCQYRGAKRRHLLEHEKTMHNSDMNRHECPICKRLFKTRVLMKHHLLSHTDRQLYACKGCNYTTRYRQTLHYHIKRFHPGQCMKDLCLGPTESDFQAVISAASQELVDQNQQHIEDDGIMRARSAFSTEGDLLEPSEMLLHNDFTEDGYESSTREGMLKQINSDCRIADSESYKENFATVTSGQTVTIIDETGLADDDLSQIVALTHDLLTGKPKSSGSPSLSKENLHILSSGKSENISKTNVAQVFTQFEDPPFASHMTLVTSQEGELSDISDSIRNINLTQDNASPPSSILILPVDNTNISFLPNDSGSNIVQETMNNDLLCHSPLVNVVPQQLLESQTHRHELLWNQAMFNVDQPEKLSSDGKV